VPSHRLHDAAQQVGAARSAGDLAVDDRGAPQQSRGLLPVELFQLLAVRRSAFSGRSLEIGDQ
jgi:hypothetical protein